MWIPSASPDGPEENSSKLLSTPFVEDPQHRLKWTAYLEFTHNNEVGDLTWDKVCVSVFSLNNTFDEFLHWRLKSPYKFASLVT